MDQSPNISKLPADIEGASLLITEMDLVRAGVSNFRQAADYPVFGSSQPTVDGIEGVLERLQKLGMGQGYLAYSSPGTDGLREQRPPWSRRTPIECVCLSQIACVPHDKRQLREGLHFAGELLCKFSQRWVLLCSDVSVSELTQLESKLVDRLRSEWYVVAHVGRATMQQTKQRVSDGVRQR